MTLSLKFAMKITVIDKANGKSTQIWQLFESKHYRVEKVLAGFKAAKITGSSNPELYLAQKIFSLENLPRLQKKNIETNGMIIS